MVRRRPDAAFAPLIMFVIAALVAAQEIPGSYAKSDLAGLRAAVEKSPDNAGLRIRLARAILEAGGRDEHADRNKARIEEVAGHFRKALEVNPEASLPLGAFARDAYYTRKYAEAADYSRRVLRVEPEDAAVASILVKALVKQGKEGEAVEFLLDWFRSGLAPSSGAVQGMLSAFVAVPKLREGLDAGLPKLLEATPRNILLRLTYAGFLVEVGRVEDAWREFHVAERDGLCDTTTGARHPFALSLAQRAPEPPFPGSYAGSDLAELKKQADANPQHAGLRIRVGRRLEMPPPGESAEGAAGESARRLRIAAAAAEYDRATQSNTDCWPAWFRSGELFLESEKPAEAVARLSKSAELFPGYVPWRMPLAAGRILNGDAAGGAADYVRYARRVTPDARVRAWITGIEEKGKKPVEALIAAVAAAVREEPKNPHLRAHYAFLQLRAGKADLAKQEALNAEVYGLVGADGVRPHAILSEAYGIPAETRPDSANR